MLQRELKPALTGFAELFQLQSVGSRIWKVVGDQATWLKGEQVSLLHYRRDAAESAYFAIHAGRNCGDSKLEVVAVDGQTVEAMLAHQFKREVVSDEMAVEIGLEIPITNWRVAGKIDLEMSQINSPEEHLKAMLAVFRAESNGSGSLTGLIRSKVDRVFRSLSPTRNSSEVEQLVERAKMSLLDELMVLVAGDVTERFAVQLTASHPLGGLTIEVELCTPDDQQAYLEDLKNRRRLRATNPNQFQQMS